LADLEKASPETIEKMVQEFENQPEMQKVMEEMMGKLVSKEIMYEPMKEMKNKVHHDSNLDFSPVSGMAGFKER
jgi:hypothetical protein